MLLKAVLVSRLVLVSPKMMLPTPGSPSQMRRLTALMVDVVLEPVW